MSEITVFAPIIDPWFVFVGRACAELGVNVRLITLAYEEESCDSDAQDCWKWLGINHQFNIEKVSLSELESVCGEICFIILRGSFGLNQRTLIRQLIKRFSRSIGLLRFADGSLQWQAKQIIKEPIDPFYSLFTEIWTEDVSIHLISISLNKPFRYFGALPHQRCSILADDWNRLEALVPQGERTYLFSCASTANHRRDSFANWVEERLDPITEFIDLGVAAGAHKIIWHYDRPGCQRPRIYDAYINEIESAWFCLCLPGYTGTTNRVLEAVLRGSIPVIAEEVVKFHCLPLLDNTNSIFVKNGNWINAVNYIAVLATEKRLAMQEKVIEMARTQASLGSISKRLVGNILTS